MTILFTEPSFVPVSGNSTVYPGAKLYFYATGTSDLQNVYTDSALSVAHANPVVADADGRFAPIYLDSSLELYKVVLKDSSDVTVYTVDPVLDTTKTDNLSFTQSGAGAVARTVESKLRDVVSVRDFGADEVGDDTSAIQAAIDASSNGDVITGSAGTYTVTGITINKEITFKDITLNLDNSATTSVITVTADNVRLENVKTYMDTGSVAATDASGIYINDANNITLINCEADGAVAAAGLHAGIYAQDGSNIKMIDCVARNSLKEGIITRDTNYVEFHRCSGYDNGLSGVGTSAGIDLLAVDCYAENSGASGLTFNSQDARIIRPKSKNNQSQNGITLGHDLINQDMGNVVVEHPEVIGAPAIGMFAVYPYKFTLIGGRFINCGDTAIKVTPKRFIEGSVSISGGLTIDGVCNQLPIWQATTSYQRTFVIVPTTHNGFAYRAIESGDTSTTVRGVTAGSEPTWPTTLGATVLDGDVTWECYQTIPNPHTIAKRSTAYTAGDYVLSDDLNGYSYTCTVGGTTDATAPTWPTTLTDTVSDGTVTWRCEELKGANGIEITSGGSANVCDINISGFDIKNVVGTAIGVTADEHCRISDGHIRDCGRGIRVNGSYVNKSTGVATFVDGDVDTGTDRITITGHPFSNAEEVSLGTTGVIPTGLSTSTSKVYYVKVIDANTIELYDEVGLTTIANITAASGGGTHAVGAVDVRVGTLDTLSINDITMNDIARSAIYAGNVSELVLDNVNWRGVSLDGQTDPVIDIFSISGGVGKISLPMPGPLRISNCNAQLIDASTSAFLNLPKNNYVSGTKNLYFKNTHLEDFARGSWFSIDNTGIATYVAENDTHIVEAAAEFSDITSYVNNLGFKFTGKQAYTTSSLPYYATTNTQAGVWRNASGGSALTPTATGTHDGGNDEAVLTDSGESWGVNTLIGLTLTNSTDGSSGTVTSNTATTITATLTGGTDNDWDTGDTWVLS